MNGLPSLHVHNLHDGLKKADIRMLLRVGSNNQEGAPWSSVNMRYSAGDFDRVRYREHFMSHAPNNPTGNEGNPTSWQSKSSNKIHIYTWKACHGPPSPYRPKSLNDDYTVQSSETTTRWPSITLPQPATIRSQQCPNTLRPVLLL